MLFCLTALPHTGHKTMLASSFRPAAHSSRKEYFTGLEMSLSLSKNFGSVTTLSRGAQAECDFSVLTSGGKSCRQAVISTANWVTPKTTNCFPSQRTPQHVRRRLMRSIVHLQSAPPLFLGSKATCTPLFACRGVRARMMASTTKLEDKFAPAKRVASQKQDVW